MATFDVLKFCKNPESGSLDGAKVLKDDWKFIARFFEVTYDPSEKKAQIKNKVLSALINQGHLPSNIIDQSLSQSDESITLETDVNPKPVATSESLVNIMDDEDILRSFLRVPYS